MIEEKMHDDLISRQAVIELVKEFRENIDGDGIRNAYEEFMRDLEQLPSAQPKKGKWIKMSDSDGDYYCCNNCGEELQRYITEVPTWDRPYPSKYSIDRTDWCPYCGAKMEGVSK